MENYCKIKDNMIEEVVSRPHWFYDDGTPVSDNDLISRNVLPIVFTPPSENYVINDITEWIVHNDCVEKTAKIKITPEIDYNKITHKLVEKDQSEWIIDEENNTITVVFDVVEMTSDERKNFIYSKEIVGTEDGDPNYMAKPNNNWVLVGTDIVEKTYFEIIDDPSKDNYPPVLYDIKINDFAEWIKTENTIQKTYTYTELDVNESKQRIKNHVAGLRWNIEVNAVEWNTWIIPTDRESQAKLTTAYIAAKDSIYTENRRWKMKNGYAELSPVQIQEMCLFVQTFIQDLYNNEYQISLNIDNCNTITDLKNLYESINFIGE